MTHWINEMIGATPFSKDALKLLSPESTLKTIERLMCLVTEEVTEERRISTRYTLTQPVTIQPLNIDFEPSGLECSALTRDIGMNGLGLFSIRDIGSPYLRVTFDQCEEHEGGSVVMKVTQVSPQGPLFFVGGSFAIDWSRVDKDDPALRSLKHPLYAKAMLRDIRSMMH